MNYIRLCDAGFREKDWALALYSAGRFPQGISYQDILTHGVYDPSRDEISLTVKAVTYTYEVERA